MTDSKTCELHSGLVTELENLKISDEKQWTAIEKLQNRLPVWATFTISLLTFLLGFTISYAAQLK